MEQIGNKINNLPNLSSIDFQIPELATFDKLNIINNKTLDVSFEGVPVKIKIIGGSYFKEANLHRVDVLIRISTKTLENIAKINIHMEENQDKTYKAGTYVINKNRELKNLGRTLWEISLKLIQKSANKWNASITHEVFRMPLMHLSEDKWNKLFFPLLEKHGYRYVKNSDEGSLWDEKWEKTYFPDKK
jgi:hypothetical protein